MLSIKDVLEKIEKGSYARPIYETVPRSPRYTKVVNGKLVTVYHALGNKDNIFDKYIFNIEDENLTYVWEEKIND